MKLRSKLKRVGSAIAFAVMMPVLFVVCGIMLIWFLLYEFLNEQLYGVSTED